MLILCIRENQKTLRESRSAYSIILGEVKLPAIGESIYYLSMAT